MSVPFVVVEFTEIVVSTCVPKIADSALVVLVEFSVVNIPVEMLKVATSLLFAVLPFTY